MLEPQNGDVAAAAAVTLTRSASASALARTSCTLPAPFAHEEICVKTREMIDYSIKITKEMAASGKVNRPVRIYADGIYDMFHSGHARQLMQAKCAFPSVHLIVGVCNDALTFKMKGRTVMNETERYEAVRHCRYVDEIVSDAPWQLDEAFLKHYRIDFVAHDDLPYGYDGQDDLYKWLKDSGRFVATERTEGISTTDVIARIIRDYDLYVRRNLARGYTAKELNVGFMKEKKIRLQTKVDEVKGKIADKSHELINKWEEKSREFISNFLELFGKDGRINQWFVEGRMKVVRAISPPPRDYSPQSLEDDGCSSPPVKRGRMAPAAEKYYDCDEEEEEEEEEEDEDDEEDYQDS